MGFVVVEREQTPLNMVEVTARLAAVFRDLWGKIPSENLMRIAAGIIGLENAGGWAIWNGNVGNITAPAGYDGRVWTANGLYFLDFPSVEEGMRAWWLLMSARYHDVLVDADQGDIPLAIRDLFRLGYLGKQTTRKQLADYTKGVYLHASHAAYSAAVLAKEYGKRWPGPIVAGASLLALGAGGFYWHRQRRAA
jgi:hypothetical protein